MCWANESPSIGTATNRVSGVNEPGRLGPMGPVGFETGRVRTIGQLPAKFQEADTRPAAMGQLALQELLRIGVGKLKHGERDYLDEYSTPLIQKPAGTPVAVQTRSPSAPTTVGLPRIGRG